MPIASSWLPAMKQAGGTTLQALGGHAANLLQTKGFSADGARQIADGKLPTTQADRARLNTLIGLLLPAVHSGGVNAGPGGGTHIHPGGVNSDGIIAILIGLLLPAIQDGTSNKTGFGDGSVRTAFGDGSVRF